VSVPERKVGSVGIRRGAEDVSPLDLRSVDTALDHVGVGFASIHEVLVPRLVGSGGTSPVLRALNVEPDPAVPVGWAVSLDVIDHVIELGGSRRSAGWAREHVDLAPGDASRIRVFEVAADIGVNGSRGVPGARNDGLVAVGLKAVRLRRSHRDADVHTMTNHVRNSVK